MTRRRNRLFASLLAGTALACPMALRAIELPTGGSVVHGTVGISSPAPNQLSILQSSQTAIVNWQGFSIGQGGRVDISQPGSTSAILNRVTGSTPSTIAGQLTANGQVYLINPNGIAITPTGTVRAGAFVGSSLDIGDEDFKAGRRVFRGTGRSAPVSNAGTIEIGRGGYAALLGGQVENSGIIAVPLGRVGLGAGEQATLDLSGDGFLQVAVPSKADPSREALIRQSGRISAPGGTVVMQAATARDAARNAINLSGVVEARTVGGRSGAIVLGGGEGGSVAVSGRLDASATSRRTRTAAGGVGRGGSITVTGATIALSGATLAANGMAGGGQIRVGGAAQGGAGLQRASTTRVDAATTISADAGATGQGGSVVVWSDRMTDFAGRISARGGALGGDGGSAEVSGRSLLAYTGTADLTAAHGRFGTLLLDPYNLTISNGADANQTGFTATGNDSVVSAATLQNALALANVTVSTGGAGTPGAQAGDIGVVANVTWTAPTTLTLSAFRNITVGDPTGAVPVTVSVPTGGGLVLRADNSGTGIGTVNFVAGTAIGQVAAAAGSTVSISYNPASNPAGSGVNATSFTAPTNYAGGGGAGVNGTGTLIASMLVNTAADLQNIRNNLAGSYALGRSIDATAAGAFNGGAGFAPIGGTDGAFTGRLNGLGQVVSNLSINGTALGSTGLFGAATGATIANLSLANLTVTGADNTGGLVGFATGTTISGIAVAGRVAGANTTGGLLGAQTNGTTTASSSSAVVTGTDNTGGFIGVTDGGSVSQAVATGSVNGGTLVGGLIGLAQSTAVTRSYATGAVTGTDLVGGLVGGFSGEGTSGGTGILTESYANGSVTSQGRSGGLIGLVSNGSQIGNVYATGLTSGGTAAGGLVGELNTDPGGGAGAASAITNAYATGLVTGAGVRGGLVGNVVGTVGTITTSYWDTQTTGLATSAGAGATGLTTAQLQGALTPGFAPATWGTQASAYPYLSWRYPNGVLAVSGFTRPAADPGAPVAGEPVRLAAGGVLSYQTNSGANGYYYIAREPLAGAAPQGATAYLDGANRGSGSTDAPLGAGAITNLDARIGRAVVTTAQPTVSGLATLLATAGDQALSANIPYSAATGAVPTFGLGLPTYVASLSPTGLTVDRSIVSAGTLQIAGAGSAAGALTSAGPITIAPNQTIQSQTGDVIVATSQFLNNAGAAAVQAGGRFLIYSQDYAADQRGGLAGANLYNSSYAGTPPGAVTQAGSQFIYTRQPVLTVSATDATREYGSTALGFTRSITGLVNGDVVAQAFTGTSSVTDATLATTGVGTYAGAAQVTQGTLVSPIGYAFAFVNAPVVITPAPLTIRADDATKVYGAPLAFAGTAFTATGLRNADQVTSATLASAGAPATAPVAGSPYAIVASNAAGPGLVSATGASNYAITYLPGALTVSPAPLTIRASDATKVFGTTLAFAGTEFTAAGLRNADQVAAVTLTSEGTAAAAPVAGSPYPILASNPVGAGLSNYVVTFLPGALQVTGRSLDPLTIALSAPTLDRQQSTFIPVSDPADIITAGPTGDETLDDLNAAGDALDAAVAACEVKDKRRVKQYKDCVAKALEDYAAKLDARIAQLPPALRNIPLSVRIPPALRGAGIRSGAATLRSVPDVIRAAARQVRASRTVAQARNVVRAAVTVIRKAITLIRADEPASGARQVRHGNAIVTAMQSVDNRLSRAVGL